MLKYQCDNCNIECETSVCPSCQGNTKLVKSEIYWCDNCHCPIFDEKCSCCGSTTRLIGSDLRPVFPQ